MQELSHRGTCHQFLINIYLRDSFISRINLANNWHRAHTTSWINDVGGRKVEVS